MNTELAYKETPTLTRLLREARGGSRQAMEEIIPAVYEELKQLAHAQRQRLGESTLNTTALVHELFVLLQQREAMQRWKNRRHFFASAALAMRCILVDHARSLQADKRGGGQQPERLNEDKVAAPGSLEWLVQLDQALNELARINPLARDIVELRYFAGLNEAETARQLHTSRSTVSREWRKARAWLALFLEQQTHGH